VLITLRHAEEVVPVAELKIPAGREIDRKELSMAEQLVAAMAASFDHGQYRDQYRARLMKMIAAKARGKIIELRKTAPKRTTQDLTKALEASLQGFRKEHHG
jgi:DNA end-binding protein Ku